jgi:hypothetical protein
MASALADKLNDIAIFPSAAEIGLCHALQCRCWRRRQQAGDGNGYHQDRQSDRRDHHLHRDITSTMIVPQVVSRMFDIG